jgi:hypothetical protein
MSKVFVLDTTGQPLDPVHPGRARLLLKAGKAAVESRISNVLTWAGRLKRVCPISACSLEMVKFDMQAMDNPEISEIEYQQGTLAGYEIREYLLEKWGRRCAYCGAKEVPRPIPLSAKDRGILSRLR